MPALVIDTASTAPAVSDACGLRGGCARHAWWAYLAAGALLSAAYTLAHLVGPGWLADGLVFNLIGGSSVAALILGAHVNSDRRLPWHLLAVGQGLFVASDVLAYNYQRLFGGALPFPSIADPFHLAFYPFLVAGMLLLIRERGERRDRAALIDALIVTLALATLLWVYLIAPYYDRQSLTQLGRLTSLAYPAMDIVVLGVVARVAAGSHRREPAFAFLLAGAVVLLLSDVLYGWKLMGAGAGAGAGALMHAGWATYYVLLGAAALHPSMRLLSSPGPEADGHLTRARLALLTCASLTAPLLIVVRQALHESLDLYVLVGSSGCMFALVLLRMAGIVRRNEELALQMVALTEQSAQAELEHQAFHDRLTGLPNRALFGNRVGHALAGQRRDRLPVAVLIVDVDDFKHVNDGLGPAAGDRVLQELASRLEDCMRPVDTAARLGGDEFGVLIHDTESELHAVEIAERVMDALRAPIVLARPGEGGREGGRDGREVAVASSVGIAFSDGDATGGAGAEELLRNADVAMHRAKDSGKNHCQVFQPEMHAKALARLELKDDLQRALDAGEFTLRYQPIMDLARGDIAGMEALLRWEHPTRGTVAPLEFVPLLEDTGMIVPVGAHVLGQACAWAAHMQRACPRTPALSMAVNVSASQLQRPELVEEVRAALEDTGVAPGSLTLELTESVMVQDMELSLLRLKALRALGVKLAIDDFGTGYSSLNYVRRLPVDILKIDRSFLADPTPEVAELTAAIVGLARIFKLAVVAEGIENHGQLERLRALDCDFGQGFHFAKPLTGEEILAMAGAQPSMRAVTLGARTRA
ncbi:MAG TPA: EAL domain-containing protein [Solirubrobacteraceae bacterium]|nr:EAL domain-containing protein [Solirubrobacteraceae bacterium]